MKSLEILFRKLILRLFIFFAKSRTSNEPVNVCINPKILFIRLNRIGDALVTTPLINEIKKKLSCTISVLADKKNSFIFDRCPAVDHVILYQKGIAGFFRIIKQLNRLDFDYVIDLHDDVSTTVTFLIACINSKYKFGIDKNNRKIYTHTVKKINPAMNHVIDRNLELAKLFGIEINKNEVNINYEPKPQSLEFASEFLRNNFVQKNFLAGINISAGNEARFWGIERFRTLLSELIEFPIDVLLLCSPDDTFKAHEISNKTGAKIFYSADFDIFAAMISRLNLLFTPDTSVIHIASAFRIPVFGIYVKYKTKDMIWSPYKSKFDCVITEEPNFVNLHENQVIPGFKNFLRGIYDGK